MPQLVKDGLVENTPVAVLARRIYKKGDVAGVQLLVQWQEQGEPEATWEDFDEFKAKYIPSLKPCGQGSLRGRYCYDPVVIALVPVRIQLTVVRTKV